MDNFDILYEQVQDLLHQLKASFVSINVENENIKNQYDSLKSSHDVERRAHIECQDRLEKIIKDNETMKKQINILEEDRAQFAKVSHIIALEKDNAKLKAELETHKAKLAMAMSVSNTVPSVPSQEVVNEAPLVKKEDVEGKEHAEEPQNSIEDTEFYEKKIKGTVYFIGTKTNTIYSKTEEDEIGDAVGKLEKNDATGKSKVVWFN